MSKTLELGATDDVYRALVEYLPEAVIIFAEGLVVFANRAAANLLRAETPQRLIGRSAIELVPSLPAAQARLELVVHNAKAGVPLQERWMCLDGAPLDAEVRSTPVVHAGQLAVQVIVRDITKGKPDEDGSVGRHGKLRAYMNPVPDVFWSWTPGDSPPWSISLAERGIMRRSLEELREDLQPIVDSIHRDDQARVLAQLLGGLRALRDVEFRVVLPDGELRWVRSHSFPILSACGELGRVEGFIEDVTGNKRLVESLAQAERLGELGEFEVRFKDLEALPDTPQRWSDEMYRICGCEPQGMDPTERAYLALVHPDDRSHLSESLAAAVREQHACDVEHRIVRHDGEVRFVRSRASIERLGSSEKPFCMAGVLQDVTDRRHMQEQEKSSEDQYRVLFENNPHPMWVFDSSTLRFVAVNHAAVAHYGYAQEEFLSMSVNDLLPKEDVAGSSAQLASRQPKNGAPRTRTHIKKNGERIDVDLVTTRDTVFEGRPCRLVLADDVTDRRAARLAVDASEEKFREIFETCPDGIAINSARDGRYLAVNPQWERLTGMSREDVIGKTPGDLEMFHDKEAYRRVLVGLARDQQILNVEAELRHKGGETSWVLLSAVSVELDREPCVLSFLRDVTERRRAAEALHAYGQEVDSWRRRHTAMVLAGGQVLFSWDVATDRVEWSGPYREVLGYESMPNDVPAVVELIHPDDRPLFEAEVAHALAANRAFRLTFRFRHADGTYRIIEDVGYFVELGAGSTREMIGSWVDVTARRLAEEEAERSRTQLLDAEAIAQLGSLEIDVKTGAGRWSDETFRIFGVPPGSRAPTVEEMIRLVAGEDQAELRRQIQLAIAGVATEEHEFHVLHPDGSRRTVVGRGRYVAGADGVPARLIGTVQDITQRRDVEEAIRQSEERFRQLADNTDEVFWVANADMSQVLYLSPAFEKVWGLEAQAVYRDAKAFFPVVCAEDIPVLTAGMEKILAGEPVEIELRIRRRGDPEPCWLWIRTFPIRDGTGKIHRIVGLTADITARKLMITELRLARDAALESDRLKSAFLANISHEVRTPLNVMLGFLSFVADHFKEVGDHSQDYCFEAIERASHRLLMTINGVLDLAKFEAKGFALLPKPVDLPALVSRTLEKFGLVAEKTGIRVVSEIRVTAFVLFDEYCLSHALNHLVDNAFKFTHKGEVAIHLRPLTDGSLALEVSDTGVGIDSAFLPRLFEPFSQEDYGFTRRFEGAGVGLALVKKYLERNGATISVQTEKGKGSTFRIHFPSSLLVGAKLVTPVEAIRMEASLQTDDSLIDLSSLGAGGRPLILVVEDDRASQLFMRSLLSSQCSVLIASNGEECRAHLFGDGPSVDLVLMDLSLKGDEDGLTLTRELRSRHVTSGLPVIAVTAHAFGRDRALALEAGCDDFLAKPVRPRELLRKIGALLLSRRNRSESEAVPAEIS